MKPKTERRPVVLVVDDDPVVREGYAAVLAEEGYRVQCAADGRSALEIAGTQCPDLVLLDLKLPELDGYSVFAWLKTHAAGARVIIVSGAYLPPDRLAAFNQERPTWLPKPVTVQRVVAAVKANLPAGGDKATA